MVEFSTGFFDLPVPDTSNYEQQPWSAPADLDFLARFDMSASLPALTGGTAPPHSARLPNERAEEEKAISYTSASPKKTPRPPNAFIIYRSDKLPEVKALQASARTPQATLSKLVAERWKAEPPHVKYFYEQQAALRKLQHEEDYPDYKFQPKKKSTKVKGASPERKAGRKSTKKSKSAQLAEPLSVSSSSMSQSSQNDFLSSLFPAPTESSQVEANFFDRAIPQTSFDALINTSVPKDPLSFDFTPSSGHEQSSTPALDDSFSSFWTPSDNRSTELFSMSPSPAFTNVTTPAFSPREVNLLPPSDYTFPIRTCEDTFFNAQQHKEVPQQAEEPVPAWWPYRYVKVVRDDKNGVSLQDFIKDLGKQQFHRS